MATQNSGENQDTKKYVEAAENIWQKARKNAFSHRVAKERNAFWGTFYSLISIITGILSILFVLFAYMVSQPDAALDGRLIKGLFELIFKSFPNALVIFDCSFDAIKNEKDCTQLAKSFFQLSFTLISIFMSTVSLLTTILGRVGNYDTKANEHDILQSLYLEISQSCQSLKTNRDRLDNAKFKSRINEIDYRFRIIKMRGSEPSDEDFRKAHVIFDTRYIEPNIGIWLRFRIWMERLSKRIFDIGEDNRGDSKKSEAKTENKAAM